MKKIVQIAIAVITASFIASCSPSAQNINYGNVGSGGGGGQRVVTPASPRTVPSSQVFRNHSVRPTADAISSTNRNTMATPWVWNDLRNGEARLQQLPLDAPVLVSPTTGKCWKPNGTCENRLAPAEAPTEAVVENTGGGGINQSIVQNTDYKFEFNLPITIINSGQGGGYGQGCYQPRQQMMRPPQRGYQQQRSMMRPPQRPMMRPPQVCYVRDNCGRIIGVRRR